MNKICFIKFRLIKRVLINSYWGWTLHLYLEDSYNSFLNVFKSIRFFFCDINDHKNFTIKKRKSNYKKYYFYYRRKTSKKFSLNFLLMNFMKKINLYFFFYYSYNRTKNFLNNFFFKMLIFTYMPMIFFFMRESLRICRTFFKEGFFYLRTIGIILFIDAIFTDDEPLWEPIEWSLIMTWILFIFIFAWIAENLITSRFGSFTGRDKRVWTGWFKTFWLLNSWFAISYGTAAMFVMLPFYTELVYPMSFSFSWWTWYNRVFFYKFINFYSILLVIALYVQLNLRWLNWKKLMTFCLIINVGLAYLLYTHAIMTFFAYFTDPLWYQKTKVVDYIQLSHEPWKWGWGPAKRDHFSYHKVSTVFWFKNDGPYASAFMMIQSLFFISLFLLYIYWLTLFRRVYTTKELTITFYVYCVSALWQFFLCFFMFYFCILISFMLNYWRYPLEFLWLTNNNPWGVHFLYVLNDYIFFLIHILI